jgi:hypothetical protein
MKEGFKSTLFPEIAILFLKLSVIETYQRVYLHPELKGIIK